MRPNLGVPTTPRAGVKYGGTSNTTRVVTSTMTGARTLNAARGGSGCTAARPLIAKAVRAQRLDVPAWNSKCQWLTHPYGALKTQRSFTLTGFPDAYA
jgi:hypothetical protein